MSQTFFFGQVRIVSVKKLMERICFQDLLRLIVWFFMQVKNLKDVDPDYGNCVETLLNKYNAEAKKVNTVPVQTNKKSPSSVK